MRGWQVKLCNPLTTRAIPECFCGEIPSQKGAISSILYLCTKSLVDCGLCQVEVCKRIMESYVAEHCDVTSDPVITHSLMRICRLMHDSVNALSMDDQVRAIGSLISHGLIRAVSFGMDLEQQLAFLVECRAAFCNIGNISLYRNNNIWAFRTANSLLNEISKGHLS